MAITRSNAPSLLVPIAHTVFWNFNRYPDLFKDVYKIYKSDRATEYDIEMQGIGIASQKNDGAGVTLATMQQGYTTPYTHEYYAIGFQITRGMLMDNLYEAQFPQAALQLRNSLANLREINAMYNFNNAFNANSIGSDGQPLASIAHPVATQNLANTFNNAVGLTEQAIEELIPIMKNWLALSGQNINTSPVKLLVPPALEFQAARILKSSGITASANNDIDAISHGKYFPGGYISNPFLTNPYNWFVLTDEPQGFKMFQRENLDIDFLTDIFTDTTLVRALERYSFGYSTWRACFAVQGRV